MYESKENLKHYCLLIKKDQISYIGNKNIDCGDYIEMDKIDFEKYTTHGEWQ
jgi:hypothetical protein